MNEVQVQKPSKGMAVAGFVTSLVGMVGLVVCAPVGVVGLTISAIALARANKQPERYGGKRLAIAGLTMGIVAILLMVVAGPAILLLALDRVRTGTRKLYSSSQMRNIATALQSYANDYDAHLPPPDADWVGLLVYRAEVPAEFFVSPAAKDRSVVSYFYVPSDTITDSPTRVLLYEMPGLFRNGVLIGYHDGRVDFVPTDEAMQVISSLTLPDGTPWAPHLHPQPAP